MNFGMTALSGTQPVWVLTSANGVTPASADAAPSVTVYEEGSNTAVQSGQVMTGEVDSKTGLYRLSLTVSTGNGYAKGKTYLCHIAYAISATSYVQTGTFTVV